DALSPDALHAGRVGSGMIGRLSAVAAELSGRWQVPLLVVALALLGGSVWRMRPQPQPPQFDDLFARAVALKEATLYDEASQYVESLLADPTLAFSAAAGSSDGKDTGGQGTNSTSEAASGTSEAEAVALQNGRLHRLMAEIIFAH